MLAMIRTPNIYTQTHTRAHTHTIHMTAISDDFSRVRRYNIVESIRIKYEGIVILPDAGISCMYVPSQLYNFLSSILSFIASFVVSSSSICSIYELHLLPCIL